MDDRQDSMWIALGYSAVTEKSLVGIRTRVVQHSVPARYHSATASPPHPSPPPEVIFY